MTRHPEYFDILLRAPEGLYSTREHWFELEAAPRDEHSPVVHLRNSYEYGALANIFMKSYFAIFGRSKVGFSVTGTDSRNKPEYVSGIRDLSERNIVHYYLGAIAYLEMHYLRTNMILKKAWISGTIGRLNTRCSFHLVRKKITLRAQSWILKNQLQEAAGK